MTTPQPAEQDTLPVSPPDTMAPQKRAAISHTVQPGETLFSISRRYQVRVEELREWNSLEGNQLSIGQELIVYAENISAAEAGVYTVKAGDTLYQIARKHEMTVEELKRVNGLTSNTISTGERLVVRKASPPDEDGEADRSPAGPQKYFATEPASPRDTSAPTSADTTFIQAHKIISIENRTPVDTSAVVNAYEEVRIWSRKFSALSDTSRYDDREEIFELWSEARAWHEQVQLSGPYIKVVLTGGDIERLLSYPEPFAVQKDTAINRLNQMTGDTLTAYFNEGDLRQIYLQGNSHLLQYTKNEQGQADGANDLTASVTRIFFEDGELVRMKSLGPIQGSYLPESPQTAERRLEGFIWTPELRPQRPEERMTPRFPPIPEERPFELPRRYEEYLEKDSY